MKLMMVVLLLLLCGCNSPYGQIRGRSSDIKLDEDNIIQISNRYLHDRNKINNDLYNEYPDLIPMDTKFDSLLNDMNFYPRSVWGSYEDVSAFDKAIYALFYSGEFETIPNWDVFMYIMLNYPHYDCYDQKTNEDSEEFIYDYHGELRSVFTSEPLHNWTIVMPGEEFRAHYFELFNHDLPSEYKKPWLNKELWNADGYFADSDIYMYYQYTDGAVIWPSHAFYILNQKENDQLVEVELVYLDIDFIQTHKQYNNYILMRDWTILRTDQVDEKTTWHDLLLANKERLEVWHALLYHREDDTYALLSATQTKQNDKIKVADDSNEFIRVYRAYSDKEDVLYDIIPQFNLTGSWSYSVNRELQELFKKEACDFKIIDNDLQAIIEINGCDEQDTPKIIQYIFDKQTKRYINQDDYELYNHAVRY